MNKKYLSALLFGALTVASTGTFTSCKDYDDDIENLQTQIDAQKSDLTTQLSALQAALKTAESNISKAQSAAEKAKSIAEKAEAQAKEAAAVAKKEAIEEAAKMVKELQAKVDGKVDQSVYDGAMKELGGKIAAIEEGLNKITTSPNVNAAAIEQIKIQLKAVEAYKDLIDQKADATEITRIDGVISSLKKDIESLASASDVEAIKEQLETAAKSVEKINVDLVTILRQDLRSLVFMPNLYVDGVEATEYAFGFSKYINGDCAEADFGGNSLRDDKKTPSKILKGQIYSYEVHEDQPNTMLDWIYNPVLKVKYHLNPSSAKVTKEDLSFISRDVESISRTNKGNDSKAAPEVVDASSENGILTVSYRANGEGISIEKKAASIMALQANVKINDGKQDTIITSDYAELYSSRITPQNIAFSKASINTVDCNIQKKSDHLYLSAIEAIQNAPTLSVEYNSSLELKDYLNIHYNQTNNIYNQKDSQPNTSSAFSHKIWNYGEEAAYGLEYKYSLVNYTNGSFDSQKTQTQVHKYGFVDEKGHFEPRYVDNNGNSVASDGKTGISSVGKKPIVRVEVVDKATGNVVLGGFVKIVIVKSIKAIEAQPFDFGKQGVACNWLTNKVTWSMMSNQLLELAAVTSKAEFEQLYQLDVMHGSYEWDYDHMTNDYYAIQYTKNQNGNFVRLDQNKYNFGSIEEYGNKQGVTNDFIQWGTYDFQRENIYKQKDHKVTVYICYKAKSSLNESSVAPIYVPVTLEVVKPVANYGSKIPEYWYEKGETQRLNVQFPKDFSNTKDYTVNLNNAFVNNKVQFTITNNVDGVHNNWLQFKNGKVAGTNTRYYYYFTAENNNREYTVGGVTYRLQIGGAKYLGKYANQLYAVNKKTGEAFKIAKLNDDKNNNFANMQYAADLADVESKDMAVAKKLLNAWAHDDKTSYFANVGIVALHKDCDNVLGEWAFKARFLRPLDVEDIKGKEFIDAQANGSTISVASLLKFTDWRNVELNAANCWLYGFYNVKAIKINTNAITTTLKGGTLGKTLLSGITKNIEFKYENQYFDLTSCANSKVYNTAAKLAEIQKKFGTITYYNNGNNVQEFMVRIPVTVSYEWGDVMTSVDCKVKPTMGN